MIAECLYIIHIVQVHIEIQYNLATTQIVKCIQLSNLSHPPDPASRAHDVGLCAIEFVFKARDVQIPCSPG